MSDLSWLNPTPHAIAVYASQPLSPVATQHSLPSGRYSLLGPDFHRLDRTSFAWRTHSITSSPLFAERNVMECRRDDDGLFRLDVGRPDHLAPFLGFVGDELSKVGGRARQPTSARRALILGSVRPALISLLSMLTIAAGVRRTRPPHRAQSHGRGLCGGSQPVVHRKGHRAASFNTSGFRFSARTGA